MKIIDVNEFEKNLEKYVDLLDSGEEDEIVFYRDDNKFSLTPVVNEDLPRVGAGKEKIGNINFKVKEGFEDISESFGCWVT